MHAAPLYEALADLMIGLHFAFLAYLVLGGFLAWRWPITIVTHVAAAIWGVLIVAAHLLCPLTWAMNEFRDLAGDHHHTHSFINAYVKGVLYPAHAELATQALVAAVVIVSWIGFAVRLRSRTRPVDGANANSPQAATRTRVSS